VFSTKFVNNGGRRGNTAQALAQWQHPVALKKSLVVLYQAMCPTSYRHIHMAIEIASNLPAFLVIAVLLLPIMIA